MLAKHLAWSTDVADSLTAYNTLGPADVKEEEDYDWDAVQRQDPGRTMWPASGTQRALALPVPPDTPAASSPAAPQAIRPLATPQGNGDPDEVIGMDYLGQYLALQHLHQMHLAQGQVQEMVLNTLRSALQAQHINPDDYQFDPSFFQTFFQPPLGPSPCIEEDDPHFPLRMGQVGTIPMPFGLDIIQDMSAFNQWVDSNYQQAVWEVPAEAGAVGDKEFIATVKPHVGYLREYYNHKAFEGCCEYWAPLGTIEEILSQKLNREVRFNRPHLVNWLLNVLRVENDCTTEQYCFQVLCFTREGTPLAYWRVNQLKGKFLLCSDPQWQQKQDQKRKAQYQQRAGGNTKPRSGGWDNWQSRDQNSWNQGYQGHHGQDGNATHGYKSGGWGWK